MKVGGRYNWRGQPERLVYIGRNRDPGQGRWHQFEKVEEPGVVWCEVLDSDLHMIEETNGPDVAALALQIADDASRVLIETQAVQAPSNWPAPVYDLTQLESGLTDDEIVKSDLQALARAAQYLEARGLLVRPWAPEAVHLVSFGGV